MWKKLHFKLHIYVFYVTEAFALFLLSIINGIIELKYKEMKLISKYISIAWFVELFDNILILFRNLFQFKFTFYELYIRKIF